MAKLISNKIKCKICGDIIESTNRHDFKWCSCKSVAVDGGNDYAKRLGDSGKWEELSEYKAEVLTMDNIHEYIDYVEFHPLFKENQTLKVLSIEEFLGGESRPKTPYRFFSDENGEKKYYKLGDLV